MDSICCLALRRFDGDQDINYRGQYIVMAC